MNEIENAAHTHIGKTVIGKFVETDVRTHLRMAEGIVVHSEGNRFDIVKNGVLIHVQLSDSDPLTIAYLLCFNQDTFVKIIFAGEGRDPMLSITRKEIEIVCYTKDSMYTDKRSDMNVCVSMDDIKTAPKVDAIKRLPFDTEDECICEINAALVDPQLRMYYDTIKHTDV